MDSSEGGLIGSGCCEQIVMALACMEAPLDERMRRHLMKAYATAPDLRIKWVVCRAARKQSLVGAHERTTRWEYRFEFGFD